MMYLGMRRDVMWWDGEVDVLKFRVFNPNSRVTLRLGWYIYTRIETRIKHPQVCTNVIHIDPWGWGSFLASIFGVFVDRHPSRGSNPAHPWFGGCTMDLYVLECDSDNSHKDRRLSAALLYWVRTGTSVCTRVPASTTYSVLHTSTMVELRSLDNHSSSRLQRLDFDYIF